MAEPIVNMVIIFIAFVLVIVILIVLFGKYDDISQAVTRFPCDIYCAIKITQPIGGALAPGGFCGC